MADSLNYRVPIKVSEKYGALPEPTNFRPRKEWQWPSVSPATVNQSECAVDIRYTNAKDRDDWTISFKPDPPQRQLVQRALSSLASYCVVGCYRHAARMVGTSIIVSDTYSGLPFLERDNDEPVFVYQVIDAIDGLIRYDELAAAIPGLSYTQIHTVFQFMRRMVQFNNAGIDVALVENEWDQSASDQLILELRSVIAQGEPANVLAASE